MIEIETKNLCKQFGDFVAVDNVNFTVEQGQIFALLGVNGAGKSTTIKMLSCLIKATSGDATLGGFSINQESNKVKEIINVSPQETAVAENLTAKENIKFIAQIYGIDKNTVDKKVNEMLKTFGLTKVANKRAKLLSGGMQRRLSIAMALISNPKILFLDEPTLGLDVIAREELRNNIKNLKGKVTILLTTHYMEEAEDLADKIGIIHNGKMIEIGTSQEIIEKAGVKNLEKAFIKLVGEVKE